MAKVAAKTVTAAKTGRVARAKKGVDEKRVVGARLINMILKRLVDMNLPERHVADLMGITPIYWNSLTNGNRRMSSLPKDKLKRLADFLGVPLIQVYILAEHFDAEDFVIYRDLDTDLGRLIEHMRGDPKWLALAPSERELEEMPTRAKMLIAALYEALLHREFLKRVKLEIPE
ncbi:helix-turn-helix domain-containing protein [Rubrivivax gelatinosus]|uniref:helix-turn-helix domain-containing protein n=1 Tax=Rubrivivax gelatinosus TaxID=28068 RepID=UPI00030096E6|nr:helix-turn-helix transcriptional regulator [Rubrivivax gelatinosus]MBG6082974.1 transcriptional regulator with XRE-family HTH domain [Rubrivivax gelatinosus]